MTAFRDDLADDVADVFLNLAEFGEAIVLGEQTMTAVIQEDIGNADRRSESGRERREGTFGRSLLLYVEAEDVASDDSIITGKRLSLTRSGKTEKWTVRKITTDEGIASILLEAVDS